MREDIYTRAHLGILLANVSRKSRNMWGHQAPDLMSMCFLYSVSTFAIKLWFLCKCLL